MRTASDSTRKPHFEWSVLRVSSFKSIPRCQGSAVKPRAGPGWSPALHQSLVALTRRAWNICFQVLQHADQAHSLLFFDSSLTVWRLWPSQSSTCLQHADSQLLGRKLSSRAQDESCTIKAVATLVIFQLKSSLENHATCFFATQSRLLNESNAPMQPY